MKKTKGRMILFTIIVFTAILAVSAWGEVKKPVVNVTKPTTQQARPLATQMQTGVRGHVLFAANSTGVEGVEVALYEGDIQSPLRKDKTNKAGAYSFGNLADKIGKSFKIVVGSGLGAFYFKPNGIEFVLANEINKMKTIYCYPPPIEIMGRVTTPDGVVIPGVRVMAYYVVNNQDIAIETKTTDAKGYCSFEIAYVNIGKEFVLRPNDPKYQSFKPSEKRFKLAYDPLGVTHVFACTGPLPDLVATHVAGYDDKRLMIKVTFVVTNQGNVASGPCTLRYLYEQWDFYGRTQVQPTYKTSSIPALAPGASHTAGTLERSYGDWYLILRSYDVDYVNVVGESNGDNNHWGW